MIERFLAGRLGESEALCLLDLLEQSEELRDYFHRSSFVEYWLQATAAIDDLNYEALVRESALSISDSSAPPDEQAFHALLQLHGSLFPDIDALPSSGIPPAAVAKASNSSKKPFNPRENRNNFRSTAILLSAFAILWGVSIYWEFFPHGSEHGSVSLQSVREKPIAVLTSSPDAEFQDEKTNDILGKPLFSKNFRLRSGAAEFLFYNGVRVMLEGPAEITLLTSNRVFFSQGNLSATVPPSGHGFEIATPFSTIRDLGTKFSAEVDAERCAVQVVEGRVEMSQNNDAPRMLGTGEALASMLDGSLKPFPFRPDRFISREMMKKKVERLRRSGIRRAPDAKGGEPVFLFDPTLSDAALADVGTRVEGRAPGRRALRFQSQTDLVRLDGKTKPLDSATFTAWVRFDKIDAFTFNPLLMCGYSTLGGVIWQIAPDGSVGFGFRSRRALDLKTFSSPVVVTPETIGNWSHLALVLDRPRRTVTHYFDGDVIAVLPFDETRPIRLDDAVVGNWIRDGKPIQRFNGAIDELRIYDRPLSADEIADFFYGTVPPTRKEP